MEDATYLPAPKCSRCGQPLPADAAEGLCPACLLTAGVETLTGRTLDEDITVSVGGGPGDGGHEGPRLAPGQAWGPYRIGRLLGRGGMGEVYEAEHIESGRRIALKVLRSRLRNAEDRTRFLREGQLAASVSHPHTVYIFGSDEIAGMPVISMELLPGGTLKDRVVEKGPLPPAEAVDAVLEIIGGLDAAAAAGILHRDIKPSNCFVDLDGSVKVGDFGLSISTLARDVRHELETSGFQGTPQFAPPEQLRGEPLDVRADIYAVGATLYYLLTGRTPFDARDLRELVARVTTEAPASPRKIRPEIPSGLAAVVLRCLGKTPSARPATYAALADLLRPYASHQETAASLPTRLLAGIIDSLIVSVGTAVWVGVQMGMTGIPADTRWTWIANFVYFLIFESVWGASPGKRLLGIAVTSHGAPATWAQIAVRTVLFYLPNLVVALVVTADAIVLFGDPLGEDGSRFTTDRGGIALALVAMYFLTARRHNGWAALHDLLSGTRVVLRRARVHRTANAVVPASDAPAVSLTPSSRRYGPFAVASEIGETGVGRLMLAFDPVLRRSVWIHAVPSGTAPVSAARRDVGRPGRLHWLMGKRSSDENWDAFEAPDGGPLIAPESTDAGSGRTRPATRHTVRGWGTVKHWLLDLSSELTAASKDGSMPTLGLERLWLRADGRLVVLDFPAPGAARSHTTETRSPAEFLTAVARVGLQRSPDAAQDPADIPLSARALIAKWSNAAPPSIDETHNALEQVVAGADRATSWRRSVPIAIASAPIVMLVMVALLVVPVLTNFFNSDDARIASWLSALADPDPNPDSRLRDPAIRTAAERYVVGRHGERMRSDELWSSIVMQGGQAELRKTADAIVARHPLVPQEELAELAVILAPEIERGQRSRDDGSEILGLSGVIIACLAGLALFFVVCASLLSALVGPGGLATRALGLAVVTRDGAEIGRGRSLARVLVAWLPGILWLAYLLSSPKVQGWVPNPTYPIASTVLALGCMALCAAWTIWSPSRGPHDRIVGTWVVPR